MNGERHGYDLKRTVDQEFAPFWRIDFAQLYRSLAKMTREGWVRVRVEAGAGGPERKMYRLTPSGRRAFKAWLQEPALNRDEFFVKLRLANAARIPINRLVETQRQAFGSEHAARLKMLHEAWDAGDAGRIILADAAFRETEASLAALDLWAAAGPAPRGAVAATRRGPLVIIGSDDPLLAHLAKLTSSSATAVGSLGGLLALARHEADVAGVHLLDLETGEYNLPFVRRLLPEDEMLLVNLAFRENGLMVARGNPKRICGVRDLTRSGIRLINRQRGAGTRLLLYSELRSAQIDPHALPDWERVASTHEAVAAAVATDMADAGPGLYAVAHAWGLDFIPLGKERYDLIIPSAVAEVGRLEPLFEALASTAFREKANELAGYDLSRTGQIIARIA
jgi:molybdate-binding protein/DNA-binding PadR family transcriptional regulator